MNIRYQWSEDGVVESVKKEIVTAEQESRCDYCDMLMQAGQPAVKLIATDGDVYVLHPHCAEKSCLGRLGD